MKTILITLLLASTAFGQVSKTIVGDQWQNAKKTKLWQPPAASGTLSTLGNAETLLLKTLITPVISGGTLSNASFLLGTVSGSSFVNGTISSSTIITSTISGASLSGGSIVSSTIVGGLISGTSLVNTPISSAAISLGTISGTSILNAQISSATILSSLFSGGIVSGASILGGTVSGAAISGSTFVGGVLSGSALVNGTVSGGSVLNALISSATISVSSFSNGTITSSTINTGVISGAAITGGTISGTAITGISILASISQLTASATLTLSNDTIVADASGTVFTLTLPSAASSTGKVFRFIQKSLTRATIISSASLVCGQSSVGIAGKNDSLTLISDGNTWYDPVAGCKKTVFARYAGATTSTVCSAGPCTLYANSGFRSVDYGGTGTYAGTFLYPFSSVATCALIVGQNIAAVSVAYETATVPPTTIDYNFKTVLAAGTPIDTIVSITCTGSR